MNDTKYYVCLVLDFGDGDKKFVRSRKPMTKAEWEVVKREKLTESVDYNVSKEFGFIHCQRIILQTAFYKDKKDADKFVRTKGKCLNDEINKMFDLAMQEIMYGKI